MYKNITISEKIVPTVIILICPAPQPKPIEIIKNKYTNSSGSLIAARNLTIESAPTKPNDKAKDDFTIVITIVVAIPKTTKFFEKSNRAHIAQIYLDADHRGKGYKKQMIDYIEDLGAKKNVKTLSLSAMKKDISARTLYESIDYQEVDIKGNVITLEKTII